MQHLTKFSLLMAMLWTVVPGRAQTMSASGNPDGGFPHALTSFTVVGTQAQTQVTANYAPVLLNASGAPLRVLDDGTTILLDFNGINLYGHRWRQGVVTDLTYARPSGSRFRNIYVNRNGMVVAVFEYRTPVFIDGVYTRQFVVAWLPNSTEPVLLNVPVARASTWYDQHAERTVEFRFLDDSNRIWANVAYETPTPEGNLVAVELARWDAPGAMPTFIGHRQFSDPSVLLLGVSSGSGEPFGYYAAPPPSNPGPLASGFVPFAGDLTNALNFVPASMNSQGWVFGRRGNVPVLYRNGTEYPVPDTYSIVGIDERNNLFDSYRVTLWTTNPQTLLSTPENPETPFIAVSTRPITLPGGYYSTHRVVPGDNQLEWNYVTKDGVTRPALLVPAEFRVDANRNGVITTDRGPGDPDRELAEKGLPWFFWVNDDDDSGETDGSDIPGRGANGQDTAVNGVRDLVDFFPVHLDIGRLLRILPPDGAGVSYRLVQADGAANYVTTGLAPANAGDYQQDADVATALASRQPTRVAAEGVALDQGFLADILQGKGVLLVEGRAATRAPLRLEVWRDTTLMAELSLPLSFAGVENMFRHVNLVGATGIRPQTAPRGAPTNWSRALENSKAMVFVHGYNVNQQQARGWQAEFFKRVWWSGSRAQFWGVTWYGTDSQLPGIGISPNYQMNVVHAFGTAPEFKRFISELIAVERLTEVSVAAHSLGNMVVSSAISDYSAPIARYFLIDAAVAAEAYDAAEAQPDDGTAIMPHTEWNRERGSVVYPPRLWASNWHRLFQTEPGDQRSRLTWRDRFAPRAGTAYYDFHSTGEEVLTFDDQDTPSLAGVLTRELSTFLHFTLPGEERQPPGNKTWVYQEKLKGRTSTGKVLGSNYGGWGFNRFYFDRQPGVAGDGPVLTPGVLSPEDAAAVSAHLSDADLRVVPFFLPGSRWTQVGSWLPNARGGRDFVRERLGVLYGTTGSEFASRHRDTLLARMIPAMSLATGYKAVSIFAPSESDPHSFDMNAPTFRGTTPVPPWPSNRNGDTKWRHSDLRVVAYPFVRRLYNRLVELGGLEESQP
jgi:hypothetical protein